MSTSKVKDATQETAEARQPHMLLEGVRIVELSAFHHGTAAGYMLGDLGADVIKIEQPGVGDPSRGWDRILGVDVRLENGGNVLLETANRSKRSIAIDLKRPEGQALAHALIEKADAFMSNYSDAVLERLGMSYEGLADVNPDLVYVHASSNGPDGPDRDFRAFDPIGQALSGLMWAAGRRDDDEPVLITGGLIDQMGATMTTLALALGLLGRRLGGRAQRIDVSMLGAAIHLQALRVNSVTLRGRAPAPHSRLRARQPLSNYYRCRDDKWILVAEAQSDRYWEQFCNAVDISDTRSDQRFADSAKRRENYSALISILDDAFAKRTRGEWIDRFRELGCGFAYAPIFTLEEVVEYPQALENDYLVEVDHPTLGRQSLVGFPITFSETPARADQFAPELGQHTEQILMEWLDMSWEDMSKQREQGIL